MLKSVPNFLFSLSLFLCANVLWGQGLNGTVVDSDGQPLGFATIRYYAGSNSVAPVQGAVADERGQFTLNNLPVGSGEVVASFVGYSKASQRVDIVAGKMQTVSLALQSDAMGLDEVIVTGVVNAKSKLGSSVSITTLDARITNHLPVTNTAELFRYVPGIRSEASAGEGNTNISARGVPISAGGSKYLQLQEDGLPVLLFGDIAFATADIFLRADQSVSRIEAVRGGAASTLASNSPAGIINLISQTGEIEGGSVSSTLGLDYNHLRTDFNYGSPIGGGVSFHVGGFFRQGEGPRTTGYTANYGGQFKANLTKRFATGHARVYYKYLNDRAVAYLPMPMQVTGTNDAPTWESAPNFNAQYGTPHSPYLLQNLGLGPDGQLRRSDVADGMHPVSQAIGSEFSFDIGEGWKVENRSRMAFNSGRFVSPFPAELGQSSTLFPTQTLKYADNGQAFASGLAMRIHMFDTELNNFNNFANDIKVNKKFGVLDLTAGYFKANQNISMSWLWNTYITDVNGEKSRLLNVTDANGTALSENGLLAYGVPAWGNCCQRNYDVAYDVSAPYAALGVELESGLSADASFRWDRGVVSGRFAGSVQTSYDVNNNGQISEPEKSVSAINNAATTPVSYEYGYASYSLGLNYKLSADKAVFARYSHGGSAKADRLLFSGLDYTNGDRLNAKDLIDQAEVGYKMKLRNGGFYLTGFYAKTSEEGGFEATTQKIIKNDYRAMGVELEGSYSAGNFDLRGGLTFTSAEITDAIDETVVGNTPRRQASLVGSLMPSYQSGKFRIGLAMFGTSQSYAQDNNKLVLPGYLVVNGFAQLSLSKGLSLTVSANNLLNAIGVTESEEGAITDNAVNFVRGRSITGRTSTVTLRYEF
ncbi:MAG: TonB-dependent receptor [Saprospiraceae bacterium]